MRRGKRPSGTSEKRGDSTGCWVVSSNGGFVAKSCLEVYYGYGGVLRYPPKSFCAERGMKLEMSLAREEQSWTPNSR